MTSNFYNRILNKIESYLTSSKTMNSQSPNRFKKSLSFSPDLLSSFSSKKLSTTSRLKRLASSIESFKPSKSLQRSSSFLSSNQVKGDRLEERLQEEKAKNSRYLSEISSLKMRIKDLNHQLHNHHNSSCIINVNVDSLIKENEDLRKFKENVFAISKKYDDINSSVLLSLKEIDQLFTRMNETRGGITYLKQMQTIESSINTFENVINALADMMKSKQDEYNYLIEVRDNDVNQLCNERVKLEGHIKQLEDTLHPHPHHHHHHPHQENHHYCHNCHKNTSICTCYLNLNPHISPEEEYIAQRLKKNKSLESFS